MVARPGADFTVVVHNALVSRRDGVACAVGAAGGLLVRAAPAVAGLAAVLVAVPALFRASSCSAGAYILYLGCRTLRSALRPAPRKGPEPEPGGPTATAARGVGRSLRQGFLTNALNPKAPVLFLSLLPQFVPADQQPLPRTLLLATVVVVHVLLWFPAVALLVDGLGRWLRRPGAVRAVEAVSGTALSVLGVVLLTGPVAAATV